MIDGRPFFRDERPRLLALELRRELGRGDFDLGHAGALLEAATARADLHVHAFGEASTFEEGVLGALQRGYGLLHVSAALAEPVRNWVIAHELGHFHLHEEDVPLLRNPRVHAVREQSLEGYSPDERRELEADVFAAEFLCPRAGLRGAMGAGAESVSETASRLRIPKHVVLAQAIEAGYGLDADHRPTAVPMCDPVTMRQTIVPWRPGTCFRVEGVPGCGKTTWAAAEVDDLIGRGTPAAKVAFCARTHALAARALTMMRPEARGVWHGTIASLAIEIMRAHPRAGRSGGFRLLDDVGAVRLLEMHKSRLPPPFVDLSERALGSMLARTYRSISHAERAGVAPKASELAPGLRQTYGELLLEADAFDAASLQRACAVMLERNGDVARHVAGRWTHLVVDDLEEAGRHEVEIVRLLAKAGAAVLCLSAPRHAIHGFRGVDPRSSSRVFPPPTTPRTPAARPERYAADRAVLDPRRSAGDDGVIAVGASHPRDLDAEARGVASRARAWVGLGLPLERQVVLARRHDTLAGLARRLRDLGLPVSHAMEAMHNEAVLDLLAIVGLTQDRDGRHLEHLCGEERYDIRAPDRARLLEEIARRGWTSIELLHHIAEDRVPAVLAAADLAKLRGMAKDLARIPVGADPWEATTTWLFEIGGRTSNRAATRIAADDKAAIHAFLGVCEEQHRLGDRSIENLVKRLRRLRSHSQETNHAKANDTTRLDTLRLSTIHAAKGRSWEGVHLVGLSTWREKPVRRPIGMATAGTARDEEALFETAVSRATRRLHLSRIEAGPPPRFILDFERKARAQAQVGTKMKAAGRAATGLRPQDRAPAITASENNSAPPFG